MSFRPIRKYSEITYIGKVDLRSWEFWRVLFTCFFTCCIIGHALEVPYCTFMDFFFGIVEDDYDVWIDPWYKPYWVYGIGAVVMTFVLEPLKEYMIKRSKSLPGALLKTFVLMVALACLMELLIGLIINQPDATGKYPYWDNSHLPGNVFGQAWLVNDVVIGVVAMVYLWVYYPLVCKIFALLGEKASNVVFVVVVVAFAVACIFAYFPM